MHGLGLLDFTSVVGQIFGYLNGLTDLLFMSLRDISNITPEWMPDSLLERLLDFVSLFPDSSWVDQPFIYTLFGSGATVLLVVILVTWILNVIT